MHFSKRSDRLLSSSPEFFAFVSHCPAKFQPIFVCFIPSFKLKYEESQKYKSRSFKYSRFQFTSNQTSGDFLGHPVCVKSKNVKALQLEKNS